MRVDLTEVMHKVRWQVKHGEGEGPQDKEPRQSPAAGNESASVYATCMHVGYFRSPPTTRAFPRTHSYIRDWAWHYGDALRRSGVSPVLRTVGHPWQGDY